MLETSSSGSIRLYQNHLERVLAPIASRWRARKYVAQYQEGTNLVLLAPDVAEAFTSAEAVNEALRLVLRIARLPVGGEHKPDLPG